MTALAIIDDAKKELIKRTVAKNASDDELMMFLHICNRTGLDPLARQIYFQKRKDKNGGFIVTTVTGIDGYRLIASRTGEYAGSDDPVFDNEDQPSKATVTVYRLVQTQRCSFTATARWDQYYPGDAQGFMWRKMPHLMLSKCAEALALRKAFPAELSGAYIQEEMTQAGPDLNEVYMETDAQKIYLASLAPGYTGDKETLRKISALAKGKTLAELPDLIKNYGNTGTNIIDIVGVDTIAP